MPKPTDRSRKPPKRRRPPRAEEVSTKVAAYRAKPAARVPIKNLRAPWADMTAEQFDAAEVVGMGDRQALLFAEHPTCDRCNEPWDVIEARRLHCSDCEFTIQIAEHMDKE